MKVNSAIVALTLIIYMLLPSQAMAAASPTLTVSSIEADAGSEIDIAVSLADNPGIASFNIRLDYDGAKLTPVSVAKGASLPGSIRPNIAQPNFVTVQWDGISDFLGNGILYSVKFKINPKASGTSALTLSYRPGDIFNSALSDVNPVVQNGTVTIKELPPSEDEIAVKQAADALELSGIDKMVENDLVLPTEGINQTKITWQSSAHCTDATFTPNTVVAVSNDGVLIQRPSYEAGPQTVVMTATITKNAAVATKSFNIVVKPTPNLVRNSGVETGGMKYQDGWNGLTGGAPGSVATVVDTEHHTGKYAIKVPARGEIWGRVRYNLSMPLAPGTKYYASAWLKTNENTTITATLGSPDKYEKLSDSEFGYSTTAQQISNSWKKHGVVLMPKPDATILASDVFQIITYDNLTAVYYIDDFTIEAIMPYTAEIKSKKDV